MSLSLVQVGINRIKGDQKQTAWDVTAGGTYATAGEVVAAADVKLGSIEEVRLPPATAGGFYVINPVYNTDGSVNLVFTETTAGAAGTPALQVKTNAEAYVASTTFRMVCVGTYA